MLKYDLETFREGAGHGQQAGICRPDLERDAPEVAPHRSAHHRSALGQGSGQGGKAAPQQLAACPLCAVAAGKPDAVETDAEVLDLQGLGLNQRDFECKRAPDRRLSRFSSRSFQPGLSARGGRSPIVPMMPPMPVVAVVADAARTVIGPDDAAARVVIIIGIIGRIIIAAAEEVAVVVVRKAEAAVVETAAMECGSAVEASTMKTSTMKT